MKSKVRLSIVLLLLSLAGTGCGAGKEIAREESQGTSSSIAELDAELAEMYALMFDRRDSLPEEYPQEFERTLQKALLDPATFEYPFYFLIDAGMNLVSSDDGRVRIFHWLHPLTGSYWRLPAILQTRVSSGRVVAHNMRSLDTTEEEGYWDFENIPPVAYQKLYRLNDATYLAIGGGQFMGSMPWINASGLQLRNDSVLTGIPLFRTSGDLPEEEVNLPLTWYWSHPGEGDVLYPSIEYDPEKRELTFPEMIPSTGDVMWPQEPTGRTIRLRFNGTYFVPVPEK